MAAGGIVGAAIVAHVARSIRSRNDAVFCNWKGVKLFHKILELC